MWVFTQKGFVSTVSSGTNNELVVRSRDRASLSELSEMTGSPILELPNRDYEYRVFVSRRQYADWLSTQVDGLDYTNYKDRVWDRLGDDYHNATSMVWVAMLGVSDKIPL